MSNQALNILLDKLSFFEVEHAKTADPAQKFALQKQIEEIRAEIGGIEKFSEALAGGGREFTSSDDSGGIPDAGVTPRASPSRIRPQKSSPEREISAASLPWYKDHRWVVPIVVALIGLTGVLVANWHGETDEPLVSPGAASVNIDTSDQEGDFVGAIPLDVPMNVRAAVPAGVVLATVKYASQPLQQGPLDVDPDCTIRAPGVVWSAESAREPRGATVSWTLGLPEANRFYAFCIGFERKMTAEEIYSFRVRVQNVLSVNLARARSATITVAEAQHICAELRQSLLAETEADGIATSGTIFDCDPAQVGPFAVRVSHGIMPLQRRIQIILEGRPASAVMPAVLSFAQRQEEFWANLSEIQDARTLSLLFDLIGQRAAKDAAFGARVRNLCPGCAVLVGPTAVPAKTLAFGGNTEEALPAPLAADSEPAQAEAMEHSYLATAGGLRDMRTFLIWAVSDSGPARKLLEVGELRALADLMEPDGPLAMASTRAQILAEICRSLTPQLTARGQELSAGVETEVDARAISVLDLVVSNNHSTRRSKFRVPFF